VAVEVEAEWAAAAWAVEAVWAAAAWAAEWAVEDAVDEQTVD
jgi:hypothetical protein